MEDQGQLSNEDIGFIGRAIEDFSFFVEYIFPLSFRNYTEPRHAIEWAKTIQYNKKTAMLSARKHLKSTIMYAYIMWRIFRKEHEDWLYMSYSDALSRYHTSNIKKCIRVNPFFKGLIELNTAESVLRYTWDNKQVFTVTPSPINGFNRGWHGYGVICDDILADPTNELNLTIINTITNTFFEEVLSLPIEGGELHLVGTPQHQEDLFFKLKKDAPSFNWSSFPAILDDMNKLTLWPNLFSYDRLTEIRNNEIGEKAFSKEYMCSPVWSESAYFKREVIQRISQIPQNLPGIVSWDTEVFCGLDIGKVAHPSHFTIFILDEKGNYIQVYQAFFDGWEYTKQVEHIKAMMDTYKIKCIYYDDTRNELEGFAESGVIQRGIWRPIKFSQKSKFDMAANFGRLVDSDRVRLINNPRQIRSILGVNSNLDALETTDGHSDAFWSIAMALTHKKKIASFFLAGGKA